MRTSLDDFLAGYRRDLMQSQSLALEVWIEKDALSRVCHRAALDYCIPVVVARGFASASYKNECRNRVLRALHAGKDGLGILYFGDFDPSGYEMLPSMLKTLQQDMKLGTTRVQGAQYALTPAQVAEHALPRNPDALKTTDSRARKFVQTYGWDAYELDALAPAALEQLVRSAIEINIDMDLFRQEQAREAEDAGSLAHLRSRVHEFVDSEMAS